MNEFLRVEGSRVVRTLKALVEGEVLLDDRRTESRRDDRREFAQRVIGVADPGAVRLRDRGDRPEVQVLEIGRAATRLRRTTSRLPASIG